MTGVQTCALPICKEFTATTHNLKTKVLKYIKQHLFKNFPGQLLNRHQPFYYGGHLIGGTSFPYVLNEQMIMKDIPNISVGGSSCFFTGGLFNPTFTSLVFAQHLVASLPKSIS